MTRRRPRTRKQVLTDQARGLFRAMSMELDKTEDEAERMELDNTLNDGFDKIDEVLDGLAAEKTMRDEL